MLYPRCRPAPAEQQTVRAYTLNDQQGHLHHAYVVVWQQNPIGGYYDFEGTDWLNPPLFAHARIAADRRARLQIRRRRLAHPRHRLASPASVLYWVTNTLLEELSNAQMLAIARSAQPLH